jgi:FkbH-like protein
VALTLNQAFDRIHSRTRDAGSAPQLHYLVTGFEPLHLETFLHAHLLERLPEADVRIEHGIYGDFPGNLERAAGSPALAAAAVLEWSDIDSRLGLRSAGGWSAHSKHDILASAPQRYAQLAGAIEQVAGRMPLVIAPPSLPLPPIGNTLSSQLSSFEAELQHQLAAFLLRISGIPRVRVAQPPPVELSLPAGRLDPKLELLAGFPYTVPYADLLAARLVEVAYPPPPKKGLITDLDNTLWAGIVGEIGPQAVSWQQESHAQAHGLYQQMLGHLADRGVLLAACSKNEPGPVEAALARADLFFDARSLFPVVANWGPKSSAIARILQTWNIAADSVVFIDDSPMELDEVQTVFPGIACRLFNGKDPAKVRTLLLELRDLFGKPTLTEEDRLRQASIRAGAQIRELGDTGASPDYLASLQGSIAFHWQPDLSDSRPLELINKTNQFNLNGFRITEGEWQRCLASPQTVLAVASYRDKFGPLGKVAVLVGSRQGSMVEVSHWVMSCRAFSRKLEHHLLDSLFGHTGVEEIAFAFRPTERNQPLQEFLRGLGLDLSGPCRLTRSAFLSRCGPLPHQVSDRAAHPVST